MKIITITPRQTQDDNVECIIEFVPMLKRNVGIGYVMEGEATAKDFAKYPVVERPWVDPTKF